MLDTQDQQKSPAKRFLFVFGFIRIAFFFVLGMLILFTNFIPFEVSKPYQMIFGTVLILYALFRAYMQFKSSQD